MGLVPTRDWIQPKSSLLRELRRDYLDQSQTRNSSKIQGLLRKVAHLHQPFLMTCPGVVPWMQLQTSTKSLKQSR